MASSGLEFSGAVIAAHRFGLGERDAAGRVGPDAAAWLRQQIGPAEPQRLAVDAPPLPDFTRAFGVQRQARQQRDEASQNALRDLVRDDLRARLATAIDSRRPFTERLALFWANHFTVSQAKGACRGLVGSFEREAIRPHLAGRFETLLLAACSHPTMLLYLDNVQSAGPQSRVARRRTQRQIGLNENLARELLELHTLGVNGGYAQADVGAVAALLTGWRGLAPGVDAAFDPDWHQPGPKTVLGQRYAEGPEALPALLRDLARHPSTARHVCTQLARHVVADRPPDALVERLSAVWLASGAELPVVYRALIDAPEAWQPAPAKLRTPEEFVIASLRLLHDVDVDSRWRRRAPADLGLTAMGQRPQSAPSPAGWPDRADEWLGPEALWQRLEFARRLAAAAGARVDARALAASSLGPLLGAEARQQIERAANGAQALALLWMAPEFQRR